MHHITTPWFLCLAKYLGSCSSEQLKVCLNWGVGAISLIFSRAFTFTPRFFYSFLFSSVFQYLASIVYVLEIDWISCYDLNWLNFRHWAGIYRVWNFILWFCIGRYSKYFLICNLFSDILSSNSSEVHSKNSSFSFTPIVGGFFGVWEVRCFWEGYEAYGLLIGMH